MMGGSEKDSGGSKGNVSAAAIKHQQLTLFFVLAIAIAGFSAFRANDASIKLGIVVGLIVTSHDTPGG